MNALAGLTWPGVPRSSKILDLHLDRLAVVYVRHSDARQVLDHRESRERQDALADHTAALGWPRDRVLVIDDDQGQSGRTATGDRTSAGNRVTMEQWKVLKCDSLPADITWERDQANQQSLQQQRSGPGCKESPRGGSALLTGLVVCGNRGRCLQPSPIRPTLGPTTVASGASTRGRNRRASASRPRRSMISSRSRSFAPRSPPRWS